MNAKVDEYLGNAKRWQPELRELRRIVLGRQLVEDFKWRHPCYTFQGSNVVILGEFKDCCTLSFFKGALLKDPNQVLDKPGPNTRAARLIRFSSVQEIIEMEPILKSYLDEAKQVETAGLKLDFSADRELDYPAELQLKMDQDSDLKTAFAALTPGRQRAYVMHFAAAKQSKTRVSRIEKYRDRILDGKGLNDCVCGLSKKMPGCDGSHKTLDSK
ncbi:YdeI/OmpD-associated family protein [Stieleria sp. TO1_6]|uniref:DUF1801 domain-containing protein n=1 Tax=Stieleria tagensis TaxID=2956795 RepID=UPI00209AF653|nr:YdeI/OmpD-associated family protein [Stieleria tagensis]MCO8122376.1 YdeI/OmpD-associated family protein [Stieleria tagensis]